MSLFENLFGKKKEEPAPAKAPPAKPPTAPAQGPEMIRVFDAYGRECRIPREEWRTKVLPSNIESNWNNPEQLYGVIFNALNDGFRAEVAGAAEQLYKIDPNTERRTCIWSIVLRETGRLDESEKVLRDSIARHGESAQIVMNLAKIYAARQDQAKAEETLWRSLELDPNQQHGFGWFDPAQIKANVDFVTKYIGITGTPPAPADMYATGFLPDPPIKP